MKRLFIISLFTFICCTVAEARHIAGGEMSYQYLGVGSNGLRYRITLKLYRDCQSGGAEFDDQAAIAIFPSGSSSALKSESVPMDRVEVIELNIPVPVLIILL